MMFLHIWLSLTFLQTLIFIILLFLPTLFFTLKYHCHYSHGINWHPLTTTGEMLSQHGWQHLENQFCFPCFIAFGTSLSTMHIYIQPGFPFASFSRFSSLTVCKSSCHFYFFITSQTWQILYSLLKWPVSKMGTAHSTSSAFLSLLSILDNW